MSDTIADFLMERLENAGAKVVFGISGDYAADFYHDLSNNAKFTVVNTTDEAHAGFAADAYARVNGIGCVCVTYNVGALKVANACACAYAERSPLVIISGSPGMKEREDGVLLHNMVRSFNCQERIFKEITCASTVLDNPTTAAWHIDRVFEALKHYKQPIYIELPRDVASKPVNYDVYKLGTPISPKTDPQNLEEALSEVTEWIKSAKSPVIMAGVELARYSLGEKMVKFAEKTNIPVVTELLSKSVINEHHPLFAGLYSGGSSLEYTRKLVEGSDCLLMFGVMLTDVTLNFLPARFQKRQVVSCAVDGLKVKNHTYPEVQFRDFCEALFKVEFLKRPDPNCPHRGDKKRFEPKNVKITTARMFEKIDSILDKNMAIVADTGDCLWGAGDLTVHHSHQFISPAFYCPMGFAIPAALGVQMAKPGLRPVVIVGDGATQMSITELSTIIDRKLNPVVFVLNNKGYSTERFYKDGSYNNIRNWNYHKIKELFDGGDGALVETEPQLEDAVRRALDSRSLFVINVMVDKLDISEGMKRMIQARSR